MSPTPVPPGALLGVVHLPPLPGSPRQGPGVAGLLDHALRDATVILEAGFQGFIVENLGDAPYDPGPGEPHVVAHMAVLAATLRARLGTGFALGVNVLRNAPRAALGIASASGADFIRVNVHTGTMVTDQGVIEGEARTTLLYRQRLGLGVAIAADVLVKHAAPLGPSDPGEVAHDTFHRGGADVLVVTGPATGHAADPVRLEAVRAAVPEAPLWLGSGLTPANAPRFRRLCDAAIVGSYLHAGGRLDAPLDLERARQVRAAWNA